MAVLPNDVIEHFNMLHTKLCLEWGYSVLAQAIEQAGTQEWIGGRRGDIRAEHSVMVTLAAWTALSPEVYPVLRIELWAYADNTGRFIRWQDADITWPLPFSDETSRLLTGKLGRTQRRLLDLPASQLQEPLLFPHYNTNNTHGKTPDELLRTEPFASARRSLTAVQR